MSKLKQLWCWLQYGHGNILKQNRFKIKVDRFYIDGDYIISEIKVECSSCKAITSKYLHKESLN